MAATATVQEGNGAGPTYTDITTARFATMDSYNPGTSNPIPVPTAGTNYSYVKTFRLKFTGTYTQITNVNIYTDGAGFGTGLTVNIGDQVGQAYATATGTQGTTGTAMLTLYSGVITSKTDIFTYTSASQKVVDTTTITGNPAYGKVFMCQMEVGTTASAGTLSAETWTWQYDEI
jgi:hypothetical protein